MELIHIAVFVAAGLVYAWMLPAQWRKWALFVVSVIGVYWLQPPLAIRYLDFIFPTATLILSLLIWWITQSHSRIEARREDLRSFGVVIGLIVALSLTRYLVPELRPTPSRAPDTFATILVLLIIGGILTLLWRFTHGKQGILSAAIVVIVVLFVVLKTDPLAIQTSTIFRNLTGQDTTLAAITDLRWLGFSYVAFRLIHIMRDKQMGRLPVLSLREHMTYVIFFPALVAGPIDRAERFIKDDRQLPLIPLFTSPRLVEGFGRIAVGMAKKFIIADSLAIFALNSVNAGQATSTGSLWLLLYAYAFRLYFDFSGYSDIAIGIGILVGIKLPENFDKPYLQRNLAIFWQSWHITLGNWVRFYVFSPLSRSLLKRKYNTLAAVLISQLVTMLIIGLWHAVAFNFIIWGVWHGIGLFLHKVWSDRTRQGYLALNDHPYRKLAWHIAGTIITFHFVVLGWVWFALTDVQQAWRVFLGLFGIQA